MIRVQLKISALFVASHFLSADEVFPEIMEVKIYPGFGTQKTCSFLSNRGVPSTEVRDCAIIIRRGWGRGGGAEKLALSSKKLDSTPLQNKTKISSNPPLLC